MKIVIIGAGRVGYGVAKALSLAENDVSVIDHDQENIDIVNERLDVKAICGKATDIAVLKESGINNADYLIAVTSSDESNLVSCAIANIFFNVKNKIIRINNRSLFSNRKLFSSDNFSADFIVCPDLEISEIIQKSVAIPGALNSISCFNDTLRIVCVTCQKKAQLANVQLKYIDNLICGFEIAIACIQRKNEIIIPKKTDIICPEDNVYFLVRKEKIYDAMAVFGIKNPEYNNLVIIGGNDICEDIVSNINESFLDVAIKIVQNKFQDARYISEKFKNVDILYGNPLEKEILDMADISNAGFVIAMTGDDRTNILSCLMAKKLGAKRVSAILNDSTYSDVIYSLGVNDILDSRQAVVSKILNFIRKGGISSLLMFNDQTEIISIDVFDNSHAVGCITADMSVRGEVLILAIKRNNDILLLPQKTLIQSGDKIIFITKKSSIERMMKLFQEKPKYLL